MPTDCELPIEPATGGPARVMPAATGTLAPRRRFLGATLAAPFAVPSAVPLGAAIAGAWVRPAAAQPADGAQRRPWPAAKPTPALELPAWDGPPFRLADARGRVVVLNFWASWCEPCRAEMPSLELLAQRLEGRNAQVLAVNFRETDGTIRRFLDQMPLTLPILRDADGGAARAFQVRIFPTTVVIGRTGRVAFTVTGELDWAGAQARDWLAAVL